MSVSSKFSSGRHRAASYVVYIAGIEVPNIGVEISNPSGGVLPRARIWCPADPYLYRLGAEDKVEVQIFYRDDSYPKKSRLLKDHADFRLKFDGYIVGWQFGGFGRRLGFTCVHHLDILNDLRADYLMGVDSLVAEISGASVGESANLLTNPYTFPWGQLFYGFSATKNELVKRPYDILINLLRACIGKDEAPMLGSTVTTNFFARFMRRVALLDRLVPSPVLETYLDDEDEGTFPILRAVRDTKAVKSLIRDAAVSGKSSPIWSVLQKIFLRMYYELNVIAAAPISQMARDEKLTNYGEILGPPKWAIPIEDDRRNTASKEEEAAQETAVKEREAEIASWLDNLAVQFGADSTDVQRARDDAKQELQTYENELASYSQQGPKDPLKPNCLINCVTKPQWFFGAIPACNVIFPSMVSQISFDESYASQPTRMYVNDMWQSEFFGGSNQAASPSSVLRAGYPFQVERELKKRLRTNENGTAGNPAVSGKNLLIWPEEFYRGPRTAQIRLDDWFSLLAQYMQTDQTTDQQQAVRGLKMLEESKGASGSSGETTLADLVTKGILPPIVGKTGLAGARAILEARVSTHEIRASQYRSIYARYEYHRQRSIARSGSISGPFNPYVLPGFPILIFDALDSGMHLVAYVAESNDSLSPEGWSTTIQFIHARTLDEFVQEVFDAQAGNTEVGVFSKQAFAPINPIDNVREATQEIENAETYFSKLLHQNTEYNGIKSGVFNWMEAFEFVLPSGRGYTFLEILEQEDVQKEIQRRLDAQEKKEKENEKTIADYQDALEDAIPESDPDRKAKIVQHLEVFQELLLAGVMEDAEKTQTDLKPTPALTSYILQNYVAIRPTKKYDLLFEDIEHAHWFVSRPVCTLDEYIAFRGKWGARVGRIDPFSHPSGAKGAKYYERILTLKPGPGEPPTFDQNNNLVSPSIADLPDTRVDWQTRLKKYRRKLANNRYAWREKDKNDA